MKRPLSPSQHKAFAELAKQIEGIDEAVYQAYDRDPLEPIIGLGPADAPLAFFGRDPGREEVRYGVPFIGGGGQLVRRGLYRHLHGMEMPDFDASRRVGEGFFWINTVPYKPLGNRAWSMAVKRQFHPLMRQLLIDNWQGRNIVTLGREAFLWFGLDQPREVRQQLEAFWQRDDRFTAYFDLELTTGTGSGRAFRLHPLPHPSPRNLTWFKRFPELLQVRLQQLLG